MDILFNAFLDLRQRLQASGIDPLISVLQIPLHQTEQHPLPAMHIDESSLEGTPQVFDIMFRKSLQLTEEDVWKHGVMLCAENQLSMSLLDKYMVNIG
ncbi:hypothetical protein BDN70DRAFT_884214 [Pholiota conissans]|uniref:DUF6589 domain-containing protein n=1 Tax=Pholiota conissans TaxID=109636 RepID=A0A9P5YSZ8_9AGAR|nr:hypothetical protein BDN70DRAFT_884214 [Pholiota conissans]